MTRITFWVRETGTPGAGTDHLGDGLDTEPIAYKSVAINMPKRRPLADPDDCDSGLVGRDGTCRRASPADRSDLPLTLLITLRTLDRKIGYYDPISNTTSDEHYRRVGTGNILTSLLPARHR